VPTYEYRHVVAFEETNLVGNVYFAHYVSWQGRCRELFLRDHAPGVLHELARDLRLVTTRASCDYFAELFAFDEVVVRMTLRGLSQTRIAMSFEYFRRGADGDELVARGEQEAACLRATPDGPPRPERIPVELQEALDGYASAVPG
jgi:enediyne core biosynthesis thioesterase